MNLNEFRNEVLKDYDGVFELVESTVIGESARKTHIRFRKIKDYEFYIKSTVESCNGDYPIFTGSFHTLETPLCNLFIRLGFGKGTDFKIDFI